MCTLMLEFGTNPSYQQLCVCVWCFACVSALQSSTSWVTKWKTTYWRPWCVARTAPLRCLMNLYQDFASYKLKQECTWMVGSNANHAAANF